jgi:hypothetical protein
VSGCRPTPRQDCCSRRGTNRTGACIYCSVELHFQLCMCCASRDPPIVRVNSQELLTCLTVQVFTPAPPLAFFTPSSPSSASSSGSVRCAVYRLRAQQQHRAYSVTPFGPSVGQMWLAGGWRVGGPERLGYRSQDSNSSSMDSSCVLIMLVESPRSKVREQRSRTGIFALGYVSPSDF